MTQDDASRAKRDAARQAGAAPPKAAPKAPARKAVSEAARKASKASRTGKPAARAQARAAAGKAAARSPPRPDKRLPGIRAAAGELSRGLDAIENARAALEDGFGRAAAGNLARAQGALDTLRRLAESAPLLDVRNLERELARLAEAVVDIKDEKGGGRKRDLLAVDDFLGDAAARLELAVTPGAMAPLKLLSERLSMLESVRRRHQSAVHDRFRARLESSRRVLAAVSESCGRLDRRALGGVARELESALGLCRTFPVGKLQGRPRDLYGIDGLVKQLDRRLARVQELIADRREQPDG